MTTTLIIHLFLELGSLNNCFADVTQALTCDVQRHATQQHIFNNKIPNSIQLQQRLTVA